MQTTIKIVIFLMPIFLYGFIWSQESESKDFKLGISSGGAAFFTGELQKLNNQVVSSSPLGLQTINNFPPTLTYGMYVLNKMGNRLALGPSYNFYTTGSRIGLKDYSGEYSFDQIISAHALGIQLEILISEKENSAVYFENIAGANFGSWKMFEKLTIGNENQKDETRLKAIKPFIYPGFKFLWKINHSFRVFVKGGVSVDVAGKFHIEGNPKAKSETKANYSGARINIGLEYGY